MPAVLPGVHDFLDTCLHTCQHIVSTHVYTTRLPNVYTWDAYVRLNIQVSDEVCEMITGDGKVDKTEECGMGKPVFPNQISYRHIFVIPLPEISGQVSSAFVCKQKEVPLD